MSQFAQVALNAARTLLNDDGVQLWTDAALQFKMEIAHRELQVQLRANACPITRTTFEQVVPLNTFSLDPPDDMIEPITLWEKSPTDSVALYQRMTEYDPLPITAPTNRLISWRWAEDVLQFIGATEDRMVKVLYKRSLPIPINGASPIGIVDGENYLGPRMAALAFGSTGNTAAADWCTQMAVSTLSDILVANRGRNRQVPRG